MPVVIAVVLLILLGIFAYLIAMERKLSRMEREAENEEDRSNEGMQAS